jgi:hypothetical protein
MSKRSLLLTNPYLRDPDLWRKMFMITEFTSARVEGVRLSPADLELSIPAYPQPPRNPRAELASPPQKQRHIWT